MRKHPNDWTEEEWIEHHFNWMIKKADEVPTELKQLVAAHYVASMIKHFHVDRGDLTMNQVHIVITAYAKFIDIYKLV